MTEESAKDLLQNAVNRGSRLAIATRGAQDAILFDGQSWYRQTPQPVKPIDTLGAGDGFITGFLVAYVTDPAAPIETALEKAAAYAAEICLIQGAFGHGLRY